MSVKVDIWSDIACPWCYVGKRRFEKAVAQYQGDVEIEYHSFELSPDTPVDFEGSESAFLSQHKQIPLPQAEQMLTQMTQLAADEGLAYDYDALQHTNTRLAHQVLHLAKEHGKQLDLKERLLKAYFTEGRHVGRIEDLADLAADVGLDRDEVVRALTDGTYAGAVDADIDQAMQYGIGSVPFFVLDGRIGVSGAQDPSVFLQALEQASEVPA